jgi:hypothetical protein
MNAPVHPPKLRRVPALHQRVAGVERGERLGHGPAVVIVEGESVAARAAFATALERELFDRHVHAVALAGNVDHSLTAVDQARALALAGLVAIVGGDRLTRMARAQPGLPVVIVEMDNLGLTDALELVRAAVQVAR